MKQIINGLLYDTQTAERIGRASSGSNYNFNGYDFYKTKNGRLFKELIYFRCSVDGSVDRLSETNETEIINLMIKYNSSIEEIQKIIPDFSIESA